jgi:PhzF family phenazine biosynthesis protein
MRSVRAPIFQVDAFTSRRFAGNPAAVVLLDEFLNDDVMQSVAAENNLSETAFLVPDGDTYRLRWFTPTVEVPLCGHATLAAAAVVLEHVDPDRSGVVFRTASGELLVDRVGDRYRMDLPVRDLTPVPTPSALSDALGVVPVECAVDGGNYIALLPSTDDVASLRPDLDAVARLDRSGVVVTAADGGAYDFVSRYFAPAKGIPEDPVTGGAHCALVPFWAEKTGRTTFVAHQASARGGDITCSLVGRRVHLVGSCALYLDGHIHLG